MNAQQIIQEVKREEKYFKNYKQDKPRGIPFEVLKGLRIGEIKKHIEFFKVQKLQEEADKNLTRCLKRWGK